MVGQSAGGRLTRAMVTLSHGKGLFHRAISQSAPVRIERMWTLAEAEKAGQAEAAKVGAASLAALRAKPADEIQRGMQTGALLRIWVWWPYSASFEPHVAVGDVTSTAFRTKFFVLQNGWKGGEPYRWCESRVKSG
jgi:carboxylesterase type B